MPQTLDPLDLRRTACDLAWLGGTLSTRFLGKVASRPKADATPVTDADHAVQDEILAALAARHPEHAIIVEEEVNKPGRHAARSQSDYCWVVDPIDGTRNFGRGQNIYACSVGVLHLGVPVAGAIYDATSAKLYSAAKGHGAFFDSKRLTIADRPYDRDVIVAVSSFRYRPIPPAVRAWLDQVLLRNSGSLCLHLAWVAANMLDAAYAIECKMWDIATGTLLIEEAGGVVTDTQGRPLWPRMPAEYHGDDMPMLVGAPRVHAQLLSTLQT